MTTANLAKRQTRKVIIDVDPEPEPGPSLDEKKQRLSDLLRQQLAERGEEQSQLARLAGVSDSTLSSWILQRQYPSESNRLKLANALGWTLAKLDAELNGNNYDPTLRFGFEECQEFIRYCPREVFIQLWQTVIVLRMDEVLAEF